MLLYMRRPQTSREQVTSLQSVSMAQDVEEMLYSDHCEIVAVADASSEGGSEEERSRRLLQVA